MDDGKDSILEELKVLHELFLPVIYSITCIFGLFGNLVVLIIFIFYEKVKTLTDIFLVNLAIADMIFLCTLPFLAYQAAKEWIFGEVMCKIIRATYRINLYTSMLILTCITFDRFISITQATKLNRFQIQRHKWGKVICAVAWGLSVILAVPQLIYNQTQSANVCYEIYEPQHIEVLVTSVQMAVGFYVPLMTMLFCYTLIIKTLIKTSSFQKHKSIKIIFTVMVVFVVTQLPFNIVLLMYALNKNHLHDLHFFKALIITEAIAYLHACLNPVLYFFVGMKFRKNFWKIMSDLGIAKHHMEHDNYCKTTDFDSKNTMSASTNVALCTHSRFEKETEVKH
ncbi:LOW QUALITY PROTEIN: C-X-C chemokine receptor type 6 [Pelodytes ibericus]